LLNDAVAAISGWCVVYIV